MIASASAFEDPKFRTQLRQWIDLAGIAPHPRNVIVELAAFADLHRVRAQGLGGRSACALSARILQASTVEPNTKAANTLSRYSSRGVSSYVTIPNLSQITS